MEIWFARSAMDAMRNGKSSTREAVCVGRKSPKPMVNAATTAK
jgi:hypothetical protein